MLDEINYVIEQFTEEYFFQGAFLHRYPKITSVSAEEIMHSKLNTFKSRGRGKCQSIL
jgi:hypothetical protein